jgi:hypothetical protein
MPTNYPFSTNQSAMLPYQDMNQSSDVLYTNFPSTELAPTEPRPSEPAENDSTTETLTCKVCEKQLTSHDGFRWVLIPILNILSRTQLNINRHHKRVHTKPLGCPLCPKADYSAAQKREVNRHLWAKHPDYAQSNNIPRERATCLECEYEGRRDNVRRHRQDQHHG